jgi:multiple sugar transport system substrate-binding protein
MQSERQGFLNELTNKVRYGRMTRRTFMERAVALGISSSAAITLLEACGSSPVSSPSTSITYWNLFGGGDGVRMVQMENDFTKNNPDIGLESVTLAWGDPYYTKMAMAASGGRPPDVAISHMTRVAAYVAQGLFDPFDLDELAKVGITEDKFLPAIWQRAHINGQLYAIPLDTHPFVMYYNTDICKKAGLTDAAGNLLPLKGPTAVIDAFKKAQQVTGGLGLAVDTQDVTPWRIFSTLYSQLGGQVLSPDGKELILDNAKAEQALSFMSELTGSSKVASPTIDYGGAVALFGNSKSGFFWQGEWEVTTFQTQKTPFNMVPFPQIFDSNATQADSHTFVLPHQIALDPARRAATLKFISFMLNDSYTWSQGGHIPSYLPVAESDQYKNLKPQSNYASVADNVVVDPTAWFSGSGSAMENQAGGAFQPVMAGQYTPAQGVKQFRATITKFLNMKLPF